jgi:hypothetical protein
VLQASFTRGWIRLPFISCIDRVALKGHNTRRRETEQRGTCPHRIAVPRGQLKHPTGKIEVFKAQHDCSPYILNHKVSLIIYGRGVKRNKQLFRIKDREPEGSCRGRSCFA